jgi:hypothetical protein
MNAPGNSETHGASVRNSLPSFRIVPQDGVGGCTPTPRHESADSIRIPQERHTSLGRLRQYAAPDDAKEERRIHRRDPDGEPDGRKRELKHLTY